MDQRYKLLFNILINKLKLFVNMLSNNSKL